MNDRPDTPRPALVLPDGPECVPCLYRTIIRELPDLVWLKDGDGRYLACNRAFERFFGAPEEKILGRMDIDFMPRDLADFFRAKDLAAIEAGRPTMNEEWLTFAEGGYHGLFETVKTPLRDAHGALIGVLGIARDISALDEARQRAEAGERRLELILAASTEGLWDWDLRSNVISHNAEWARLLGIADGRLARPVEEFTALIHPDDRQLVADAVRELILGGKPVRREHRIVTADGAQRWVIDHGTIVGRDDNGRVVRLAGSLVDITERKAAEYALRDSEQRFRAMAENSADGIWVIDVRGRSVYSNRTVETILGLPQGAKVDDDPFALLHPDDAKIYVDTLTRCVNERSGWQDVVLRWWSSAVGRYIPFESSAAPLFDAAGRLEGFIGIDRDISAREAAAAALRESEEHYRRISELTSDVIFSCHREPDGKFRIDWCAGNVEVVFGFSSEELLARGCWRCSVLPEDMPLFERYITGLLPCESSDFVLRILHADGSTRWLRVIARVECDPEGRGEHRLHSACQDVTARHAAEIALRESEGRYRALFENSADGIFVTRGDRIADCNPSVERIFRCKRADLIGRPIGEISPASQADGRPSDEAIGENVRNTLAGGEPTFEWRHQRPDGSLFDAEVSLSTAVVAGEPHIIATLRDVTERKQAEAKIEFLAHHDPLTGLPNRVLLRDRYEHARAYAERNGSGTALLFIDLDNFKAVNDSLGHAAGDELLKAVVARLAECVRDTDTVSRQGGDEFIVLMSDIPDPTAAERVAGEILLRLAEPFAVAGHVLNSGASIGIALHPGDGEDFDTLLQKADTAMYTAKAAGRNTCRFFAEAMNTRVRDHLLLQGHLHRALAEARFRLAYQPKYDIAGCRVTGLEALLRLDDPEFGELPPGRFIPVAEDCGLIVPIGRWVLDAACRQVAAWRAAGLDVPPVSVNISGLQVHRAGLVGVVAAALDASGIPPHLLEIELTESILLHDVDNTLATVRGLKQLGLALSIDDFGTGYSSLAYLKRFAVDKLKIDQSFVRDIASDPEDAAIVRAIIQLARALRLGIVAEGVETAEQLAFLRAEGCEEVQGFLFGRPVPPEEAGRLLRAAAAPV